MFYHDIVVTMYFSGKRFPKQCHVLNMVFRLLQIMKIQIHYPNAIMMANVFKYLPKSEAAVSPVFFKKAILKYFR